MTTKDRPTRLVLNGVDDDNTLDFDPLRYQAESWARAVEPSSSSFDPASAGPSTASRPRHSKFIEDESLREQPSASAAQTSPVASSLVNPATVPIRRSSNNAVVAAGKPSPGSSKKSPQQRMSMASVPESWRHQPQVDERVWLAQDRYSKSAATPSSSTNGRRQQQQHTDANQESMPGPFAAAASMMDAFEQGAGGSVVNLLNEPSAGWSMEKENILKGPFDYIESHPGKDIRTQMITAFDAWLQVPTASLSIITGIVTMLHSASLLIDDVEDSSQLRRGVPVAHSIFGTAQTINSANYIYFCALQEVLRLNNPEAIKIYTEELLNLHRGQGMDLFWRDTLTCPSEDDYLEMVSNKTGGLFRLAIKLMCAESSSHGKTASTSATDRHQTHETPPVDYVPLVNTIGLLFQILDDYRNLSDTTYTANKGLCEDLTEGKFSFPVIHAIRAAPSNLVLINILKQKTTDEDVKRYAVSYIDKCGSFSYTRRVLRGLTKKALQIVDEVDAGRGNADGVKSILERLRVDRSNRSSV